MQALKFVVVAHMVNESTQKCLVFIFHIIASKASNKLVNMCLKSVDDLKVKTIRRSVTLLTINLLIYVCFKALVSNNTTKFSNICTYMTD